MRKKLMLRLCLMTIALLSLPSCRQDLLPEKETYHNTSAFQLTSKRISLNESKHKERLLPEIEKAEAEFKKHKPSTFEKTVNYGNGVSIDTDDVIYIENGANFHTYTFNIKRANAPETAPLENLLLIPETDGSYKEFLVTYNLTAQEKEKIRNGEPVDTKGKTAITELAKGSFNSGGQLAKMSCNWTEETIWQSCSEGIHNASNVETWHKCKAETPPSVYTIITGGCNIEQPETIDYPGGPGSGTGTGPGGSDNTDPGTPPDDCTSVATDPTQVGLVSSTGCNIGVPTLPNIPNPTDNPCRKTNASITAANNILHDTSISAQVTSLEGHAANSFTEYGMAIINTGTTTVAQDPYTNNDPNNPGTVSITIPSVGNYLASAHSHPDHGAAPPSVADFYADLKDIKNYPTFKAGFVFANNGTKYAFVVNDRAKAEAFLLAYPFVSNTTPDGRMFNENSQVGRDFINILKDYMQGRLPSYSGNSQNDGLESAYAEILQKYDTGISLAKTDANGNLKSLRSVSFKHTVSASGGKTITGYRAEKCP